LGIFSSCFLHEGQVFFSCFPVYIQHTHNEGNICFPLFLFLFLLPLALAVFLFCFFLLLADYFIFLHT